MAAVTRYVPLNRVDVLVDVGLRDEDEVDFPLKDLQSPGPHLFNPKIPYNLFSQ